jgi:hypothetical protein
MCVKSVNLWFIVSLSSYRLPQIHRLNKGGIASELWRIFFEMESISSQNDRSENRNHGFYTQSHG